MDVNVQNNITTKQHFAFFIVIYLFFLSGCQSTPANKNAILLAQQGEFESAKQTIRADYSATGKSKLLHYLELGMLNHLQGNYQLSNQQLTQAQQIIEEQYTISVSESALALLSGPSFTTYAGKVYHRPLINFYKALNYNALANQPNADRQSFLDSALVEMRQLDTYLSGLKDTTGGYDDEEQPSGLDQLTEQIDNLTRPLFAPNDLLKDIEYKDDAFAHYVSGILFERSQELDSARIQYQRAIQAFENGFAKQYDINPTVISQIKKDLIRVMEMAGGYSNEVAQLKSELEIATSQTAQPILNILQDVGIGPQRKQFNLLLNVDEEAKALVMTPILWGTRREQQAQMRWFQMLYADTSIFDLIQNYATGDISDVVMGGLTKRIPLGPLWDDAVDIGLISALQYGSRISVTYLEPLKQEIERSEVWVGDQKVANLDKIYSVSLLTLQDALNNANSEIQIALAREIVKSLTAQKAISATGLDASFSGFAKLATSVVNAVTASADLRQWHSLPAQINYVQLPVSKGEHTITLKTYLASGIVLEQSETIQVVDDVTLWHTRTFLQETRIETPDSTFL
ncbi:hypothetical protein N476_25435 [Pseudoalteromonas luteoviolacea H33]|uniref:Uncharacterized protein n=1 Tax=Pseudoalteromonas luteoviolacea H33 TaxID=1365251 RepID=A0A167APK7_9GAMM|nr:hypothetical protein N476_25435 [Pseudoalteromonas luteoviolacea H33]KZN69752.1 hypothetical protein N477_26205 [Pseudoalteromonas luteoviolacea H33-S]